MATKHTERSVVEQTVGFVGDSDAGKTTVATLLADRLHQRSAVRVRGEAADFVDDSSQPGRLGIDWTVIDCPAGPAALAAAAESLDTVFVVTTPETLGRVGDYSAVASQHNLDCFLVVNRVTESAQERLRAFEGPEIAEYVHEDGSIPAATSAGEVPTLEEWTVETMLIEALQPERVARAAGIEALDNGTRRLVNVEVSEEADGHSLVRTFEEAGHSAAYYRCNCRCHDGHVLARRCEPNTVSGSQNTGQVLGRPEVAR